MIIIHNNILIDTQIQVFNSKVFVSAIYSANLKNSIQANNTLNDFPSSTMKNNVGCCFFFFLHQKLRLDLIN